MKRTEVDYQIWTENPSPATHAKTAKRMRSIVARLANSDPKPLRIVVRRSTIAQHKYGHSSKTEAVLNLILSR